MDTNFLKILAKLSLIILIFQFIFFQNLAQANESEPIKKWAVGIGSYDLSIHNAGFSLNFGGRSYRDEDFSGQSIFSSYNYNDSISFRGLYYLLDNDNVSSDEISGIEVLVDWGSSLQRVGFKYYLSAGFYTESFQYFGEDENFTGYLFNLGVGYNWKTIAVDLIFGGKDTSDYESFFEQNDLGAQYYSINISYRF